MLPKWIQQFLEQNKRAPQSKTEPSVTSSGSQSTHHHVQRQAKPGQSIPPNFRPQRSPRRNPNHVQIMRIPQIEQKATPEPLVLYLQGIELGDPNLFESLSVVPLYQREPPKTNYYLLDHALETGGFKIEEVSENGQVPFLKAQNDLDIPVLILDGEELIGAKQNRIANASFLIPPQTVLEFPVSCVEKGRWAYRDKRFKTGNSIYGARARRRKHLTVTQNIRKTQSFSSNQGQVWKDVQSYINKSKTTTGTQCYSDYLRQRQDDIDAYREALPYQQEQIGQLVFLNEQFLAIDCLNQADKAQHIYPKMMSSYTQEALDPLEKQRTVKELSQGEGGQKIFERLWQMTAEKRSSVGWGHDLRFEDELLTGSALVYNGQLLHLEVFPNLKD